MAEEKVSRTCKEKVKDEFGTLSTCGRVVKGQCPNFREHVLKFKTGGCQIGACEGVPKVDAANKPVRQCKFWKVCPCDCHKPFDEMHSMSQRRREAIDNGGYQPPESPYRMPTLTERAEMAMAGKGKAVVRKESPIPGVIPETMTKVFVEPPSGGAAKGQLEAWVKEFCDEHLVEQYKEPCTPQRVAEAIAKKQGLVSQSSGAVDAVFKRWESYGFAVIERKPTRFVGYTDDGARLGLEALRLRFKSKAKQTVSPQPLRSLRRKEAR